MLFPQLNSHRAVYDLDGYWNFLPDPRDSGEREKWFLRPLPADSLTVAVPGAWNEQLAERGLMNYVGCGWYEREFILPARSVKRPRTILRVGSAEHRAHVWLNGHAVGFHEGGFLPFEFDLTDALGSEGAPNRLTICVDSRLSTETLPQGIDPDSEPYRAPGYERRHVYPPARFDFFPYGGLSRPVQLLVVPEMHICTIAIQAAVSGMVRIRSQISGDRARGCIQILGPDHQVVAAPCVFEFAGGAGEATVEVPSPLRWSPSKPILYSAEVSVLDENGRESDQYTEQFGFREIRVEGGQVLLNGTPLYLAGFGKHEDLPIVGRGQSRPSVLRDFELMRWAGANSFRTSHYPYDEEVLRLADRLGFLVIDEVPAVSLGFLTDRFEELSPLLENHRLALTRLIERDRNHPSVIAWSVVNEPNLWDEPHYQTESSRRYFREIYDSVRALDPERPVMVITAPAYSVEDVALEACDVIGINRYFGWYTDPVDLEKARRMLEKEMDEMFARHGKPIMITECGVDTVEGFHATTPKMFTEEYQTEFLRIYAAVADSRPFCTGFHVWNFSDFLTPQNFRRVVLNRKGVFTRSREPKAAAFFLRSHWSTLERVAEEHRPAKYVDAMLIPDIKPAR